MGFMTQSLEESCEGGAMISPERLRRFANNAHIPENLLKTVAMHAENHTFKAGDRIFSEGNNATHFMIVEEGEVDLTYQLGDMREVVVDTLVAGDSLSWSALIEPHTLSASAVANSDGSLIRIDGSSLRQLCHDQPDFGLQLMREVATVLRERLIATRVQLAAAN
jgi:CRP-like cAMP-binding protein